MPAPNEKPARRNSGYGPAFDAAGARIPWEEATEFAHAKARQFCGRRFGELAADVAQESLIRLSRHASKIRCGWKQLLSTIVVNRARTRLKQESRTTRRFSPNSPIVEEACADAERPDEQVAQWEAEGVLEVALGHLDEQFGPGTRAIVDFRAQHPPLPWGEISRIVGLADRTCRYRHESARDWLTRQFRLSFEGE